MFFEILSYFALSLLLCLVHANLLCYFIIIYLIMNLVTEKNPKPLETKLHSRICSRFSFLSAS